MKKKFQTVTKFLWKPMKIAGESRWLCRASWREEFIDGEWMAVYWVLKENRLG